MRKYSDLFVSRVKCSFGTQAMDSVLTISKTLSNKFPFLEADDICVMLRSVDEELLFCLAKFFEEVNE